MSDQPNLIRSALGNLRSFYSKNFYPYQVLYLNSGAPIIVYSMTKSGSTSLHESIRKYKNAIKVHSLAPDETQEFMERRAENYHDPGMELLDQRGRLLYQHVAQRRRFAKYITLVRNPLERDISRFFQKFNRYAPLDNDGNLTISEDDMVNFALDKIEHDKQVGLDWFDDEYKKNLGIDIYEHPFPRETGIQRLQFDHADVLLMKLETPDEDKVQAVRDFLEVPDFNLDRTNVASEKEFADVYKLIKKRIILPEAFIDNALASKITRHFYTTEEIEASRTKWVSRVAKTEIGS